MRPVKESRLLTVALAVVMAALLLSASIATPILCRPFYYAHIDALRFTETTPWSEGEIRQAFDEMLDFCVGKTDDLCGHDNLISALRRIAGTDKITAVM